MTRDPDLETDFGANPLRLKRLREYIERLSADPEARYGVRFDDNRTGAEFAYSWAAIWSEN